ncbi:MULTISPECIES: type II secretion system F family protein [unclassified Agrococcus]|uniref:type II secretion system F family protein n=1 Tax=unclassified Agrococcus TaxID=2615065 RepID=UPI0036088A18
MPVTLIAGAAMIALALAIVVAALATSVQPERSRMVANLRRGGIAVVAEAPARPSRREQPLVVRLTPAPLVAILDQQHARAGRPAGWALHRILTLKAIWLPSALAVTAIVAALRPHPGIVLLLVLVTVVGYFVPDLLLLGRGQERDQAIQRELADTLDQMLIAVDAGLGFDSAMSRVASNGSGSLSEELTRTLQDVRMGRSRREAFADLAERTRVADLRQFVRAILQADAYGISVSDVLRTQASEMRLKRRMRAEEQAQKVPVKVLMPLMLCILPVLFIVVMAPAALNMIAAFSGL